MGATKIEKIHTELGTRRHQLEMQFVHLQAIGSWGFKTGVEAV